MDLFRMLGGGARFDKKRFKEDIEVFQVRASSLPYTVHLTPYTSHLTSRWALNWNNQPALTYEKKVFRTRTIVYSPSSISCTTEIIISPRLPLLA